MPELGAPSEAPVDTSLDYGSGPAAEPARAAGEVLSGDRYRVVVVGVLLVVVALFLRRWSRRTAADDD